MRAFERMLIGLVQAIQFVLKKRLNFRLFVPISIVQSKLSASNAWLRETIS